MINWTKDEHEMLDNCSYLSYELISNKNFIFTEEDLLYFTESYDIIVDSKKCPNMNFLSVVWNSYLCNQVIREDFIIENIKRFKNINWECIIKKQKCLCN